jgi:hypothetical protein
MLDSLDKLTQGDFSTGVELPLDNDGSPAAQRDRAVFIRFASGR